MDRKNFSVSSSVERFVTEFHAEMPRNLLVHFRYFLTFVFADCSACDVQCLWQLRVSRNWSNVFRTSGRVSASPAMTAEVWSYVIMFVMVIHVRKHTTLNV